MKILLLADEESKYLWDYFDKSKLEGIDLIISCGDLSPQYLSFLATFSHAPVLYVHGNHDVCYKDLENEVEMKALKNALGNLSERERIIVDLRYGLSDKDGEEKTQKEVADLLGISQSYISRLEKRIMKRLKKEIVKYV